MVIKNNIQDVETDAVIIKNLPDESIYIKIDTKFDKYRNAQRRNDIFSENNNVDYLIELKTDKLNAEHIINWWGGGITLTTVHHFMEDLSNGSIQSFPSSRTNDVNIVNTYEILNFKKY